ncbi:MAG: PepSY domain-containing protein [Gammaproteobacteria bacterium]|nr:PepSY domain-containing protein [Gammaproteobacteria bacterium]
MPRTPLAFLISVAVALAPAAAHGGDAEPGGSRAEAPQRGESVEPAKREASARVSLKDATAIVRQAFGGRVLSATEAQRRGSDGKSEPGYRFRVDVEGTVKTVFVDARGRIHES